jgi:hypothetical protein
MGIPTTAFGRGYTLSPLCGYFEPNIDALEKEGNIPPSNVQLCFGHLWSRFAPI